MKRASLEGRRILVVEDDYMIAQDVSDQLRQAGATVIGPVPSVAKAHSLIEKEALDAAVLDVNLGEENSFPIAQSLRAAGVPFLFSTGYHSGDIPTEWKDIPVSMKPLQTAAVEQLLAIGGAL